MSAFLGFDVSTSGTKILTINPEGRIMTRLLDAMCLLLASALSITRTIGTLLKRWVATADETRTFVAIVVEQDCRRRRRLNLIGPNGAEVFPDGNNVVVLPRHWDQETVDVVDLSTGRTVTRVLVVRSGDLLTRIVVPRAARRQHRRRHSTPGRAGKAIRPRKAAQ